MAEVRIVDTREAGSCNFCDRASVRVAEIRTSAEAHGCSLVARMCWRCRVELKHACYRPQAARRQSGQETGDEDMVKARPAPARKGGPPRKAAEGLDKVLFVRANQELLDKLDGLLEEQRKRRLGVSLSRADVARTILWEAIQRQEKENDK